MNHGQSQRDPVTISDEARPKPHTGEKAGWELAQCTGRTPQRLDGQQKPGGKLCGSKERHDAAEPAKLILQLSHRALKECCRKASWLRTCCKGGSAKYADQVENQMIRRAAAI